MKSKRTTPADPQPDDVHSLYRKHRPQTFDEMMGQDDAVKVLRQAVKTGKVPHAILFTGPSGTGKTTAARILGREMGIRMSNPPVSTDDFVEMNCSDFRGVDTVRDIRSRMGFTGLGKTQKRAYLLDEVQKMTSDAQNAMLKMLEDTPKHVYFILATTDPAKILKTVQTRCTEVRMNPLTQTDLRKLVRRVAKKEGMPVKDDEVLQRVAEAADGSARKALVILESLAGIGKSSEQLRVIEKNDDKAPAIAIARSLLDPKTTWQAMAKVLRDNNGEDAEAMRHMVLGYCTTILLSGQVHKRAAAILDYFSDNFYDSKRAGLVLACFNVISSGAK